MPRLLSLWYNMSMNIKYFDKSAAYFPDACFKNAPDLGILLGSGWGEALVIDEVLCRLPYADIPGLGASTVKGHTGEFILYRRQGKLIAAWCGRRHYYEGEGWEPVVLPVELLRRMGCSRLLLTNASGGINPALRPGDMVIVRDHINLISMNPLVGPHFEEWGERFPDMSEVYSTHLSELLHAAAKRTGIRTMDGVYAYNCGPAYETPAEVRAYRSQGADVVGMSTVPEAVFARACGLKVAGISFVTNLACGLSAHPLNHEEVMAAGAAAKGSMGAFLDDFLSRL